MIQDVPSAAFSMSLLPPLGQPNPQLRDALKKLSATKFGKPRAQVEQDFFKRMSVGDEVKKQKMAALKKAQEERMAAFKAGAPTGTGANSSAPMAGPGQAPRPAVGSGGASQMAPSQPPSFLDEWLTKRQQIMSQQKAAPVASQTPKTPQIPQSSQASRPAQAPTPNPAPNPAFGPTARLDSRPQPANQQPKNPVPAPQAVPAPPPAEPEKLHIHDTSANANDEGVSVKLR